MALAPGAKIGHLTVIEAIGRRPHGEILYSARCDCGRRVTRSLSMAVWAIEHGKQRSAYCTRACKLRRGGRAAYDLRGERFGSLTALRPLGLDSAFGGSQNSYRWLVRCDCGAEFSALTGALKQRSTRYAALGLPQLPACHACALRLRRKRRTEHPIERAAYNRLRQAGRFRSSFARFLEVFGTAPSPEHRFLSAKTCTWVDRNPRWTAIEWRGRIWNMSKLAAEHGLLLETLRLRLKRGEPLPFALRPVPGKIRTSASPQSCES